MTQVKVMYWKEVPVQVKATDDSGEVTVPLDGRFQQAVDSLAMFDGSAGSDEYLEGWQWGETFEDDRSAEEAAKTHAERFNKLIPRNFVATIREQHKAGTRKPFPGVIDTWLHNSPE